MASDMKHDGTPFTWTEKLTKLRFGGERDKTNCRCKMCDQPFQVGQQVQFIFCNGNKSLKCPNFFAHESCVVYAGGIEATAKYGSESYENAVTMAKWWNIYGPDWQHDG